jgi:hypothetical protein
MMKKKIGNLTMIQIPATAKSIEIADYNQLDNYNNLFSYI